MSVRFDLLQLLLAAIESHLLGFKLLTLYRVDGRI